MWGAMLGAVGAVTATVSLVATYCVLNMWARGTVVALVAAGFLATASVQYTTDAEQRYVREQPYNNVRTEAEERLRTQGFALRSVRLDMPNMTTGEAEFKESLPGSYDYPLLVLQKENGRWYAGCRTLEGTTVWLRDSDKLLQEVNAHQRCPAGLSASNYANR